MKNEGAIGWAVAGVTAVAFDLVAEDTMSSYAREKFQKHPAIGLGVLALSAFHLTRPEYLEKYDPITQVSHIANFILKGSIDG